jgi:hypothetical protein
MPIINAGGWITDFGHVIVAYRKADSLICLGEMSDTLNLLGN